MDIADHIRTIPDFPKPGILFYDISTLLAHAQAWRHTVDLLAVAIRKHQPDMLIGIESRGFLVAAPLALQLGCGLVMARKTGKLPGKTISHTYELEYGTDTIELQSDAIQEGQKVVILDDLLATGGTAGGALTLLRQAGADVRGAAFIIELNGLGGRDHLDIPITSLLEFDA
ncbi:MAG: adenine phosphoribosyltransferase [Alphaproteobacteria bacterium]|jgi:adenine phosphoribosyltransferase|nr:adenine phosphoribosyltransferase [Alphaproteobacteria bacterium]